MSAVELRSLDLWDDVECNGGTRQGTFTDVGRLSESMELRDDGHLGREELLATVDGSSSLYSDVQTGYVLRVDISDGSASEWRIVETVGERSDAGLFAHLTSESIAWDLFRRTPLLTYTADNFVDLDFQFQRLTPTEWVDDVMLQTDGFPTWISKGTINSSDKLSLPVDGGSAGTVLNHICNVTGYEWTLRRNGSTDYKIDIVQQRGFSTRRPLIALKRNLLSASRRESAKDQATRVYPRGGGPRGHRATMGPAKWKVTGVS